MIKYMSKENIALTISLISIFISLYNFLKKEWNERTNFRIDLKGYIQIQLKDKSILHLHLSIINESKLPISITSMELKTCNQTYYFSGNKTKIYSEETKRGNVILHRNDYYSTELPKTIQALGSIRGHFHVELLDINIREILEVPILLIINTNRKSKSFDIELNPEQSERWPI